MLLLLELLCYMYYYTDHYFICQSKLPEGAHPLCLVLYADKTRLSSFGTAKGYPVMARCANLPADLRNGEGVGGGRVVGFLPIVSTSQLKQLL